MVAVVQDILAIMRGEHDSSSEETAHERHEHQVFVVPIECICSPDDVARHHHRLFPVARQARHDVRDGLEAPVVIEDCHERQVIVLLPALEKVKSLGDCRLIAHIGKQRRGFDIWVISMLICDHVVRVMAGAPPVNLVALQKADEVTHRVVERHDCTSGFVTVWPTSDDGMMQVVVRHPSHVVKAERTDERACERLLVEQKVVAIRVRHEAQE
mmetsp:Transcript_17952/g.32124  ORF Transcript_17952/g.32124 Transcript_17952/m.32124 type:complete len:213 (+) Transcript_17952:706-1344(+)